MKTKRFVSMFLTLCLVLILGRNIAFAFDSDAAAQRYTGLSNNTVSLVISDTGLSTTRRHIACCTMAALCGKEFESSTMAPGKHIAIS